MDGPTLMIYWPCDLETGILLFPSTKIVLYSRLPVSRSRWVNRSSISLMSSPYLYTSRDRIAMWHPIFWHPMFLTKHQQTAVVLPCFYFFTLFKFPIESLLNRIAIPLCFGISCVTLGIFGLCFYPLTNRGKKWKIILKLKWLNV